MIISQRKGNFQNKLLLLVTVSVVLPLTVATLFNLRFSSRSLTDIVKVEMQMAGQDSANNINLSLNSIQADVTYLSKLPAIQALINQTTLAGETTAQETVSSDRWLEQIGFSFQTFIQSNPYYDQLRYIDETGQEVVRVDMENGAVTVVPQDELQNKSTSAYFQNTIALPSGELYISQINLNRENGEIEQPLKPVIRYASPIYDAAGQSQGILVANVRIADLFNASINEGLEQALQQDLIVVNPNGYYLFHPDPDKAWGFEFNQEERLQNDVPEAVATQVLSGDRGITDAGIDAFLSYETVVPDPNNPEATFILMYRTPKSAVLQPLYRMRNLSAVIIVVALIVMLPIAIIWLRQIMRSLQQLTSTVSQFSEQMSSTIVQQEDVVRQQASSVQETTVTIDQLSQSSRQSAEQANAAVSGGHQVIEQIDLGQDQIEKTLTVLNTVQAEMQLNTDKVDQLTAQVQRIGRVSSLISELAGQTNMLAINAAIEAVRAGENGQGFGVVATEIRKLADESQRSSEQISQLVQEIHQATQAVVEANQRGQVNVDQSMTAMQQMAAIFNEIAGAIQTVVGSSQQIALNSQQQAQAISQVTEAMSQLNEVAQQSADGIRLTREGTQQLQTATTQLEQVV